MLRQCSCMVIVACALIGCGKTDPPTSGGRTASYWVEVLQKPDPDVGLRRKAAEKLGSLILKDNGVMPALLGALKDADVEVRLAAVRSLTIYSGPRAKEVMPALSEVLEKDPEPLVREAAGKAIEKLTNGSTKAA